ncbi:hypothetical protein EV182_007620, partial [Spiromyces aspiralis]
MQVRSFMIKVLLGYLPVMKHEATWYLLAYPEPKMAKCLHCEHKEETQEHFFKCKQDDPERGEEDWGGQKTKMVTEKYLDSQNTFIGLTEVVHRALQLATFLDWSECTKAKIEWEYQHWKARCEAQINREEG